MYFLRSSSSSASSPYCASDPRSGQAALDNVKPGDEINNSENHDLIGGKIMTNSQRKPPTGARENQVPASTALPIRHGASGSPAAGATAAGFGTLRQHSAARRIMRRRTRFLFIVT